MSDPKRCASVVVKFSLLLSWERALDNFPLLITLLGGVVYFLGDRRSFEPTLIPTEFVPDDTMSRHRTRVPALAGPIFGAPRRLFYQMFLGLFGLGFGLVIALPFVDGTQTELPTAGGFAMFYGSLTGMLGTYLALIMVVLASRVPLLEKVVGQGTVIGWHKKLAPWPLTLIAAHAVLLTMAYAESAHRGVVVELGTLLNSFPHVFTATIALGLMMFVGLISIYQIRSRMERETWWSFHLLMYVALVISFAHEVVLGPSFVRHPLTQLLWTLAWVAAAALIVTYRVAIPLYRSIRHGLRVVEVRPEGSGVYSVVFEGRDLDRLDIAGGQFFEWRFLSREHWKQTHPFTVSAKPMPPFLRITVKGVGDFSSSIASIKPNTAVAIEGPYGAFTAYASTRAKAALIAGGIGVTAIRALVEDLTPKSRPIVVCRATSEDDLVLTGEIDEIVRRKKGVVHRLVGNRDEVALGSIAKLIPDIKQRDVFVCGSPGFVQAVIGMVRLLGVQEDAIHFEEYSL